MQWVETWNLGLFSLRHFGHFSRRTEKCSVIFHFGTFLHVCKWQYDQIDLSIFGHVKKLGSVTEKSPKKFETQSREIYLICWTSPLGLVHKWRHTLTRRRGSPDLWQIVIRGRGESVVLWCHTSRFDMHATRSHTSKERCGVQYVSILFTIVFCCKQWGNFCRYC